MATDALDLDDLERMLAASSPAPWKRTEDGPPEDVRICSIEEGVGCVACLALLGDVDGDGNWDAATIQRWTADADLIVALRNSAETLIASARERDALREALAFYAHPATYAIEWKLQTKGPETGVHKAFCPIRDDDGERARTALSPGGEPLVGGGGGA